jgi:hypothetical protein
MIVRVAAATLAVCEALDELVEVAREVELELRLVAVLAPAATVVIGVPAESKRNLPTPVSQQSFVWSQQ